MKQAVTGGLALAKMLEAHDVELMFGMGGFQLLPLYDGLRRLGIAHHLIADERSGAFAADAYSRVTGKVAVVDATLGPGATNLVSALVESLNAGIPMVAVVGGAHRAFAGRHMTQEGPQAAILGAASKAFLRIEVAKRIPEIVRRAFQLATTGRPGPVVIEVPEDVCHEEFELGAEEIWADSRYASIPAIRTVPAAIDLDAAVARLAASERPVIIAGGGVHLSWAYNALAAFAETLQAPVAYTISGKGAIADDNPLSAGLVGRYSRFANDLIEESDCLVVVGCKLGEIATRRYALPAGDPTVIHVDVEPSEPSHWLRTDVALWGDADATLALLAELLGAGRQRDQYRAEIAVHQKQWSRSVADRIASDRGNSEISVPEVVKAVELTVPADAVVIADGGFAAHWSALYLDTRRAGRHFLANRGFASIGYGLPGCLGASLASPDARVVGISGDGGFNMSAGELETCVRLKANLVLIVLNNAASGYVKALQHAVYGKGNYQSSDLGEVDYSRIADAYGAQGFRVTDRADLLPVLEKALSLDGPVVIDAVVTRDPALMLPGIDSRTSVSIEPGDRPA